VLSVQTADGARAVHSTAFTVGAALAEAGLTPTVADRIEPAAGSPLNGPATIRLDAARQVSIEAGGGSVVIWTAADTVAEALAAARMPLVGLDYSQPAEHEGLPADGRIRIVHVSESVVFSQKPIAFESEFVASAQVELDQQQVLQPGQPGLTVSRARVRYEDGQEVARQTESEVIVRPPQKRVVGYGTQVVTRTAVVDGVTIEYWRAVQMFATSYSPCRSAADRCYPGTSSGKPVTQGVVAVVYRWYLSMQGQPVYIPGYGRATIEDVGGGIPGRYWIDLGYSDADYQEWGDWVTVYFLTPVPQSIVYVLD
jgi:3D (Asp-Asp-Asp) domain-containing protein